MKKTVFATAIFLGTFQIYPQQSTFKEKIDKQLHFSVTGPDNSMAIVNICGSITVEGYDGNTVLMEVSKTITADTAHDLETGKEEVILKTVDRGHKIIVYPDSPYLIFDEEKLRFAWDNDHDKAPYKQCFEFFVKVPRDIALKLRTTNNGNIRVENMEGPLVRASNVNGGIELVNVSGRTDIDCLNGEVVVSYAENPKEGSRYHSLNGDIRVSYQEDLSANICFKSMNGKIFTDFGVAKQYLRADRTEDKGNARFKHGSITVIQIGSGGIDFEFETLNGNVYIDKM